MLEVLTTEQADDLGLTPVMDSAGNVTIIDLLLATNGKAFEGLLYDTDESGGIDSVELVLRRLAHDLYSAIGNN